MAEINLNKILNAYHLGLFQARDRELVIYGGAGAGKTYSIIDKLLLPRIYLPRERIRVLVIRKAFASIRRTLFDIFERRAEALRIRYRLNRGTYIGTCGNIEFIFTGMHNEDDYQKIKSMTDLDFIWVNEATELRESDYKQLLLRLRGGRNRNGARYRQILMDFNPVGTGSWVYHRMFERNVNDARKIRYTVLDNPWAEPEYVEALRRTEEDDPNYYKIYFEGEWGELEGQIYDWDYIPLPDLAFDELFYGLDFGYSIDPAVLVRVYRKADEYWLEELVYETGLTNQELGVKMRLLEVHKNDDVYADSAEPKSIQELCNLGFTVKPSAKGPDSVRAGIDFLRSKKIHIVEGSTNILKERNSYIWKKDKDGYPMNVPISFMNHAMDASRYAIDTHIRATKRGALFISEEDAY